MSEMVPAKTLERRSQRSREMLHKYGGNLKVSDGAAVVVTHSAGGGQRSGRILRTVSGRPHADFAIGVRDAVTATSINDILCSIAFKQTRGEVLATLTHRRIPMTTLDANARIARKIAQLLDKITVSELIDHAVAYGQYGVTRAPTSVANIASGAVSGVRGHAEAAEEEDIDFDMDCRSAAAGAVPMPDARS